MVEVLHKESFPQLLELIRQNWSVVLNHNKGAIAPDDVCKKINLWTKLLPFTPYFEWLVKKTEHLSLAHHRCGVEIHDGVYGLSATPSKCEDEYGRLFDFFKDCELFQGSNPGQVLDNNSFWEFIIFQREAQTNRTNKEKETVPLTPHEEELETMFFSSKALDAAVQTVDSNEELNDFEDDKMNRWKWMALRQKRNKGRL
jgi:hypothetical protein